MKKSAPPSKVCALSNNGHYNPSNALNTLLSRLEKVQSIGNSRYKALCPAHDDRSPSLAIKDDENRLLLHCFCGCDTADVLGAIGLTFADIMPNKSTGNFKKDRKPFYAMDVLGIIKNEATLAYIYASDMARGLTLTGKDTDRLLLATSRINHAYEVTKNGL
jgi:hypothetical protein